LAFEILGDPLEHQTYLGTVDWNIVGLPLAGLAQVDCHELAALQPFQPIDAFAQQLCRWGQGTTGPDSRFGDPALPGAGCGHGGRRHRRVQKLVDARWAQPHCYGDLPYRQASPMCRVDGSVSLRFSRFEPVRHEAEAIAYGSLPLDALARLFRCVHSTQVAKCRRLCLENWTPYRRILRRCYSRASRGNSGAYTLDRNQRRCRRSHEQVQMLVQRVDLRTQVLITHGDRLQGQLRRRSRRREF